MNALRSPCSQRYSCYLCALENRALAPLAIIAPAEFHADNGSFQPFCHSPLLGCAVGNEYLASNYIYFADRLGFLSLFFVSVRVNTFKNREEAIFSTQVQKRDSMGYLSGQDTVAISVHGRSAGLVKQ
jgi:hypothetical protein